VSADAMSPLVREAAEWLQIAAWVGLGLSFVLSSRLDRWTRGSGIDVSAALLWIALGITFATMYADEAPYWNQIVGGFLIGVGYIGLVSRIPE
jgi:hypothetical protein